MQIDAHNHPNWHGHNARRILENMDEQGIDRMWLLSWESPVEDYDPRSHSVLPPTSVGIPLADVLEVGGRAPERFVLGYVPHPKRPDAVDRLKAAVAIHGVRVAGEYKVRLPFDDLDAIALFRACGELRLPVTFHLEYPVDVGYKQYPRPSYWYGGSIEALERALAACPETVFIGHGPGWWAHVSGDDRFHKEMYPRGPVAPGGRVPELLRRHVNLYADLSATSGFTALSRDREFGRGFLNEFQDRLLFGRDSFDSRLMDHLKGLDLSPDAFEKLCWRNAHGLVRR